MLGTHLSGGRKFYLLFLAIVVSSLLPRQTMAVEPTLTLNEATALTLARNPQLYRYSFANEIEQAQKQQSALRPPLNLDLELENVLGSGPFQGIDSAETTIALSSVIELGDKRSARASVADSRIYRTQWEKQAETLNVLGDLATTYINGLSTQNNILIAQESLRASKQLLRTVKNKVEQGATPEVELLRAKANVAEAETRLLALSRQFDRQKVQLAGFWGETRPEFGQLDGDLFEFGPDVEFDELFKRVENSPAMEVFASEARIKEAELALARANNRTDVTWQAGVRRFEDTGDTAFVAGVSIPLFASQRSSSNIQTAQTNRDLVSYNQKNQLLRLRTQLYEAWSLRQQNIEAVRIAQTRIIPALEQALRLTEQAYENGRYQYFDLIAAQEELLAAKQRLIDSASNAHLSQALIEQLTNEPLTQ